MLSVLTPFLLTTACAMTSSPQSSLHASESSARALQARSDPFPTPREGLKLAATKADGSQSMLDVVNEFTRVTGETMVIDPNARTVLQGSTAGLNQAIDVPASEVYFVIETLLVQRDLMLVRLNDREPRMLGVYTQQGSNGSGLRGRAVFVGPEQLSVYARHPALLITTSVDLPYTDVRTLSNSMRSMFQDASTQQIVPVGNTSALILTGTGSNVFGLVEMLRAIDDASRREFEHRSSVKSEKPVQEEKPKDERPSDSQKPR